MADKASNVDTESVDTEVIELPDEETENAAQETSPQLNSEVGALMRNPAVLAAVQDRLSGMIGMSGGYIQSLPKVVKRRLKALKKLQFESTKIEAKFYEEVHLLECKYASKYVPLFEKRKEVVTGAIEPTDSDCDWPSDEEEDELAVSSDGVQKVAIEDADAEKEKKAEEKKAEDENVKGVPFFWLTVFKNVEMLADMIQEHDEPIFKHLEDIKVKYSDKEPYGFTLEFIFSENEFFTNAVLVKEYELRVDPDESDPFSYEGVEIIKCKGCTIDWNKGKNVTVKTIKKTQRHKGRGTKRTVTKQVQNDSFFNFFMPPADPSPEAESEDDEDAEALLAADFEIGQFIRERVIPKAVLYFTGEALEEDDDYDDEEGEEEDGEEEDFDEEADPDFNPAEAKNPQECKQQ